MVQARGAERIGESRRQVETLQPKRDARNEVTALLGCPRATGYALMMETNAAVGDGAVDSDAQAKALRL